MNNVITFGKYEGRTFEWMFFNVPGYVEWMYNKRVHRQSWNFDEEQGDTFAELYRRASHLRCTCRCCQKRQITRMSLSFCERFAGASHVNFYCDDCEHVSEGTTIYSNPSFFPDYNISVDKQAHVVKCIKNHFIGSDSNLTQKRMEEFFHKDANFVRATPRFFTPEYAARFGY